MLRHVFALSLALGFASGTRAVPIVYAFTAVGPLTDDLLVGELTVDAERNSLRVEFAAPIGLDPAIYGTRTDLGGYYALDHWTPPAITPGWPSHLDMFPIVQWTAAEPKFTLEAPDFDPRDALPLRFKSFVTRLEPDAALCPTGDPTVCPLAAFGAAERELVFYVVDVRAVPEPAALALAALAALATRRRRAA